MVCVTCEGEIIFTNIPTNKNDTTESKEIRIGQFMPIRRNDSGKVENPIQYTGEIFQDLYEINYNTDGVFFENEQTRINKKSGYQDSNLSTLLNIFK